MNSERYSYMIGNHLKQPTVRTCRGLLSSDVCLQRDNGRPHTAALHTVKQTFRTSNWRSYPIRRIHQIWQKRFSWSLNYALNGSNFTSGEEVKAAAREGLLPGDLYLTGTLVAVCRTRGRGGTTMKINGTVSHPFLQ